MEKYFDFFKKFRSLSKKNKELIKSRRQILLRPVDSKDLDELYKNYDLKEKELTIKQESLDVNAEDDYKKIAQEIHDNFTEFIHESNRITKETNMSSAEFIGVTREFKQNEKERNEMLKTKKIFEKFMADKKEGITRWFIASGILKDKGYKVVERFSFDKEDMTLQFYVNDKELDIPCEQISGGELIKNLNKCGVVPTVTNEIKTEFFNFSLDSAEADELYFPDIDKEI